VSSAFAGGHQLQRTQGMGVPAPAERAHEKSVFRRLEDNSLPLGPRSSRQGFEARDRRCDLRTSDSEQEPVGLALCVRRFAVPACFCSTAHRALPSFVCLRAQNPQELPLDMLVHCQN